MPWSIEKRGDKYCVVKDSDHSTEACHDTKREAQDHMKALYSNEPKSGVEKAEEAMYVEERDGQFCLVMSDGSSECFATNEEAQARMGEIEEAAADTTDAAAETETAAPGDEIPAAVADVPAAFRGVLAATAATDDGRYFRSFTYRPTPLSFMVQIATAQGPHEGAQVGGRIDWIEQRGRIMLFGGVYNADEFGQYAAARAADGSLTGVSMDAIGEGSMACTEIEDTEYGPVCSRMVGVFDEAMICAATQLATPAFGVSRLEVVPAGESPADVEIALNRLATAAEAALPPDPTFVPFPESIFDAFFASGGLDAEAESLVAMAGAPSAVRPPVEPPGAWFEMPEPDEWIPLHITAEGQVYGHIAAWGTCHTGFPNACVTAPTSPSGYEFFNLHTVVCDDGSTAATGPVTVQTSHADAHLDAARAMSHYDNSGCAVADVTVSDGVHGVWACGAARPTITPEQVREFNATGPSGDWRQLRGRLDLIAVLMVNTQGFPLVASAVRSLGGGRYEQGSLIIASVKPRAARAGSVMVLEAKYRALEKRLVAMEQFADAVSAGMGKELFAALCASIEQE